MQDISDRIDSLVGSVQNVKVKPLNSETREKMIQKCVETKEYIVKTVDDLKIEQDAIKTELEYFTAQSLKALKEIRGVKEDIQRIKEEKESSQAIEAKIQAILSLMNTNSK